jgi:hypothetical protein
VSLEVSAVCPRGVATDKRLSCKDRRPQEIARDPSLAKAEREPERPSGVEIHYRIGVEADRPAKRISTARERLFSSEGFSKGRIVRVWTIRLARQATAKG